MLHHILEDLESLGDVGYLGASPFEHFNFVRKSYLKMPSLRKGSTIEKSVQVMNSSQDFYKWKNAQASQKRVARLRRERFWVSLACSQNFSFPIVGHLGKDAKISFERCYGACR